MRDKNIIILGMHRSGTSLLSNWISDNGVFLGDDLLAGNFTNKNGHFEDIDFLNLHKRILMNNDMDKDGLDPADFLKKIKISEIDYSEMRKIIKKKMDKMRNWGWKDPRSVLFFNYYNKILPDLHVIAIYRNYRYVVNSLLKRDLKTIQHKLKSSRSLYKRIKIILNKSFFEKMFFLKKNSYLKVWNHYNNKIIELSNKVDENNFIIISLEEFLKEEGQMIVSFLKKEKIEIKETKFSEIFNKDEISENKKIRKISFDIEIENESKKILKKLKELEKK